MLPWDEFRLVKAVADTRSLAGAGGALGVNTSTVFRRLGALEKRLGARLFERGRAGYALTPAGEEMVELAERMAEDVTAFERRIAGRDLKPSGELRVTTPDSLFVHALAPMLARFKQAYPDIRLDVVVANHALNLSRRDADIAVRATANPPETLVGRRVADIAFAAYGRRDGPHETLPGAHWIGYGESMSQFWPNGWLRDRTGTEPCYRINTVMGMAEAVRAGPDIGPLPCFIGDHDADLVRLSDADTSHGEGLWLLTHADLRSSARVRAFLDFAAAEFGRLKPLFEGRGGDRDGRVSPPPSPI